MQVPHDSPAILDSIQPIALHQTVDLPSFAVVSPISLHETVFAELFASQEVRFAAQVDASPSAPPTLRTGWCCLYAPTGYGLAKVAWPWAEISSGIFCRSDITLVVSNIQILKGNDLPLAPSGLTIFIAQFLAASDWTARLAAQFSATPAAVA